MPAISVIMPIYNSAAYLSHAVESVLRQEFDDFELLLVDDGSTDESAIICDRYAERDKRVVALHKKNGGMCNARNYGMSIARGEYITFCDNDDEMLPGHLLDNYTIAQEDNSDCVRFCRQLVLQDKLSSKPRITIAGPKSRGSFYDNQIFENYELIRNNSLGVWNGLYRKTLIEENAISFDERLRHGFEDQLFNIRVFATAKVISTNPVTYYSWIRRTSHSSSFHLTDDYRLGFELAVKAEHELMLLHEINLFNPRYFGWVMVDRLLLPMETMLLTESMKRNELIPVFEWEHEIFAPYAQEISSCPLSPSKRLMHHLLRSKRYNMIRTCMEAASFYLRLTKRS